MKKKKNINKTSHLLKIGILLFGSFVLLWSCQDNLDNVSEELEYQNTFEKLINPQLASEQLGLGQDNLSVNWQQPTTLALRKKELGGVYQYPMYLKKPITNGSDLFVKQLTFQLIVHEKQNKVDFTILRYEPFKNSLNIKPSESDLNGFSGMKFIFDKTGILQDIYTYENGKKIASFNENKDKRKGRYTNIMLPKASSYYYDNCTDLNGNAIENCTRSNDGIRVDAGSGGSYVLEITRYYTDYYNRCNLCDSSDGIVLKHTDGNTYIYHHTTYNGNSSRWVWISSGGNRYVDVYDPRAADGNPGPTFDDDHQRNYKDRGSSSEKLPCPVGFEKTEGMCIKIIKEEDKIIDNELTGKAYCVYKKMVDKNNNINWILENFNDGDKPSEFDLKFEMSTNLGNDTNASFSTPFQSSIPNTFVIKINQNTLEDRTALGLARTILHEGIHARLWEFYYRNGPGVTNIDFPGIYDYMRVHGKNWDHEQMAAFYIETIAQGLKQFDNAQHSATFYNALAWEGLAQYKDANNKRESIYSEVWNKLSSKEQKEILNTITNEKQNGSKECN